MPLPGIIREKFSENVSNSQKPARLYHVNRYFSMFITITRLRSNLSRPRLNCVSKVVDSIGKKRHSFSYKIITAFQSNVSTSPTYQVGEMLSCRLGEFYGIILL